MTMSPLKEAIRYFCAWLVQTLCRVFGVFLPTKKKRILFDSFTGEQYSCNPKALYEYMLENGPKDYEYVWAFRTPERFSFLLKNPRTVTCRYHTLQHYYYSLTSGIVVLNCNRANDLPYRKGQIRLQTWHGGGCYKKIDHAIADNSRVHNWILSHKAKVDFTHFVSSSRYFTDYVVREQVGFHGTVMKTGMPRNDDFFHAEKMQLRSRNFRDQLGIDEEAYIVLYAPTYRDHKQYEITEPDYEALRKTLQEKTGKKVVILYRGHHVLLRGGNHPEINISIDLDVSDYPDMQDILMAADLLLTDYSSSIWDYSFTGKPCLLYTPDLEYYLSFRGFDKEIHEWGFPVCETNEELLKAVRNFDTESYREAMEKHHRELGSYENGNAAEIICKGLFLKSRERGRQWWKNHTLKTSAGEKTFRPNR